MTTTTEAIIECQSQRRLISRLMIGATPDEMRVYARTAQRLEFEQGVLLAWHDEENLPDAELVDEDFEITVVLG